MTRDVEHMAWINAQLAQGRTPANFVEIVEQAMLKSEAKEQEIKWINAYRPRFNKNFSYPIHKMTDELLETCNRLKGQGFSYKEVAKEIGVSAMTVHRAMAGKTKVLENFIG